MHLNRLRLRSFHWPSFQLSPNTRKLWLIGPGGHNLAFSRKICISTRHNLQQRQQHCQLLIEDNARNYQTNSLNRLLIVLRRMQKRLENSRRCMISSTSLTKSTTSQNYLLQKTLPLLKMQLTTRYSPLIRLLLRLKELSPEDCLHIRLPRLPLLLQAARREKLLSS